MNFGREVARQTSCYTYVIEDDDPALASLNIFELAEKGDHALLESLVRKNPEVLSEKDEYGAGPVHHAAAGGHIALIRFISAVLGPQALNSCDERGDVPLHWAVDKNQAESCKVLLDLLADPNVLNAALLSPLHLAISQGHNKLVELLLSYNTVDYNLPGDLDNTPVMMACSLNNCQALSLLLNHGARLCQQNKLGHFAVHAAAFAGAKKALEFIMKSGEELGYLSENHINYLDKSNSSPLHLAVRGGNIETIGFCIDKGARIDQKQHDRSTPLHLACTQGAVEVVKMMLCSHGQVEDIINLKDGACQTPLHKATIFDHVDLAEYLISLGADVDSVDCKGNPPLLLATSCGAWRTLALLLSKGADVSLTDRFGCNFLHLAILQPKGLKNVPEDVLQRSSVKALLSCEDNEGCTPLHYACRLGIHDSVRNMLGLSGQLGLACKSKDKKSALHFAAQYGRINTCHRLLETITDSRLLNEGDERGLTPLHLASRGGHTQVVGLLLRKGALFHSDYKGWTCLHHAASEGYTQTMDIILSANMKLLDKTDEDGNTALHIAARMGHVAAAMLMVNRGAEFLLNKTDTSFLHEALQNGKQDVVNAVIDSERCAEALTRFKPGGSQRCPIMDMIEYVPETYKHLLDCCVKESDDDPNCHNYHIEYDFKWLQAPLEMQKKGDKLLRVQPLAALNTMVKYNRLGLLNHPVCKKYLSMKWVAYGSKAHLLNMFIYLLGLLPLTHLIVTMRPTMNITATGIHNITMVPVSFAEQSVFLSVCMVMVLVMNVYAIVKEVLQIIQQRWDYLKDYTNQSDWSTAISCLLFVIPLMLNAPGSWYWQAGAIAIFNSWLGFLLYLQRFEGIGIYVVMFGEICRTLIRIVMLFFYLLLAFALAFHSLLLDRKEFENVPLSMMQTFVMMVGELNYQNNILEPYLNRDLPFSWLTYMIFFSFVLTMPIVLINLLIGLAVGDIAEVQRNAAMKRIAMQIDLHTALEDKLPYWFIKRADKCSVVIYPNRKCSKKALMYLLGGSGPSNDEWKRTKVASQSCSLLETELKKQKSRLKDMFSMMEKQHNLLKLIIQKMEITAEADEHDGPVTVQGANWKRATRRTTSVAGVSRWVPLMKAIESKHK
ncbi:transient receptor potential cation channel subfamily A member 1b [Corythoichthys intestinalis]|uniref:transient receptor potential cation channel subfamily A member 1b n=1 Tax=Corythoichthys intestinalis TaxID=161448 RepID=UPI0025A5DFFB|nr:transient receptor potential cation channel subfamily A member 1b [Corythoichthys intestinalis]XP_061810116.1 transient receptor potential cation channel subfamily A member 1-like [Nerophis lumbriciformis]